jgi:hypothetical protein
MPQKSGAEKILAERLRELQNLKKIGKSSAILFRELSFSAR